MEYVYENSRITINSAFHGLAGKNYRIVATEKPMAEWYFNSVHDMSRKAERKGGQKGSGVFLIEFKARKTRRGGFQPIADLSSTTVSP